MSASIACSGKVKGSPWLCTRLISGREEAAVQLAWGCAPGTLAKGLWLKNTDFFRCCCISRGMG